MRFAGWSTIFFSKLLLFQKKNCNSMLLSKTFPLNCSFYFRVVNIWELDFSVIHSEPTCYASNISHKSNTLQPTMSVFAVTAEFGQILMKFLMKCWVYRIQQNCSPVCRHRVTIADWQMIQHACLKIRSREFHEEICLFTVIKLVGEKKHK